MKRVFELADGSSLQVAASAAGGGLQVLVHQGESRVERQAVLRRAPNGDWLVEVDGVTRTVQLSLDRDTVWASHAGTADYPSQTVRCTRVEERRAGQAAAEAHLRSPMTGRVVVVHVREGDAVEKGQPIVVVEAMKMEHTLKAPRSGHIARVACAAGQLVDGGAELVTLEPEATA